MGLVGFGFGDGDDEGNDIFWEENNDLYTKRWERLGGEYHWRS